MEINVNGNTYTLHFGIGFVRHLNSVAGVSVEGMDMGMALQKTLPALAAGDPAALADVIYAAAQNKANRKKLTADEIEDWLDGDADLTKLFEDVTTEIKESNSTKTAAKNLLP